MTPVGVSGGSDADNTLRYGNKQGTFRTYLADAATSGKATFVFECAVDTITHAASRNQGGRRKATGVVARVGLDGHRLVVRAKRCVVVACGSLHSPCLLLRSSR